VAAVLANASSALRLVDLRGNFITKDGVKVLAEALERHPRTKHVYVHAGGKIEALGTTAGDTGSSGSSMASMLSPTASATGSVGANPALIGVETVCVVDVRDQKEPEGSDSAQMFAADLDDALELSTPAFSGQMTTAGPGSAFKLKMTALGSAADDRESSNRLFARRPLSAATLKKQREKLAAQRRKKLEDARALAKKEAEWAGRAGGMDSTPSPGVGSAKKLPPIGSSSSGGVSRISSAPVLKKKIDDENDAGGPEVTK